MNTETKAESGDQEKPAERAGENPMAEKVTGYRKLNDRELALVNELKADGQRIEDRLREIETLIRERSAEYGTSGTDEFRSLALGKTNLQQAYMWLIRAVAAPRGIV